MEWVMEIGYVSKKIHFEFKDSALQKTLRETILDRKSIPFVSTM